MKAVKPKEYGAPKVLNIETIGTLSWRCYKHYLIEVCFLVSPVLSLKLLFQYVTTSVTRANNQTKFSATGLFNKTQRIDLLNHELQLLETKKVLKVGDVALVI